MVQEVSQWKNLVRINTSREKWNYREYMENENLVRVKLIESHRENVRLVSLLPALHTMTYPILSNHYGQPTVNKCDSIINMILFTSILYLFETFIPHFN